MTQAETFGRHPDATKARPWLRPRSRWRISASKELTQVRGHREEARPVERTVRVGVKRKKEYAAVSFRKKMSWSKSRLLLNLLQRHLRNNRLHSSKGFKEVKIECLRCEKFLINSWGWAKVLTKVLNVRNFFTVHKKGAVSNPGSTTKELSFTGRFN